MFPKYQDRCYIRVCFLLSAVLLFISRIASNARYYSNDMTVTMKKIDTILIVVGESREKKGLLHQAIRAHACSGPSPSPLSLFFQYAIGTCL